MGLKIRKSYDSKYFRAVQQKLTLFKENVYKFNLSSDIWLHCTDCLINNYSFISSSGLPIHDKTAQLVVLSKLSFYHYQVQNVNTYPLKPMKTYQFTKESFV